MLILLASFQFTRWRKTKFEIEEKETEDWWGLNPINISKLIIYYKNLPDLFPLDPCFQFCIQTNKNNNNNNLQWISGNKLINVHFYFSARIVPSRYMEKAKVTKKAAGKVSEWLESCFIVFHTKFWIIPRLCWDWS